ncbi:Uu.00g115470.m01.CDS01 [Anthostomella pinea]|uniref:Uu.00g115470.m01.CDS01 n=1 Tax=Anthostomella pinea TaxID=933095 RepID=A0AAI8YEB7_9PEZI|nr:Uu.00g115470.m01.CDS01 [Anthostomella pinea]
MDKITVQVEGLKIAPPGEAGSIKDLEEKKGPNSGFEQKWWNEDVGRAMAHTKAARKRYQSSRLDRDFEGLTKARQVQKQTINNAQTKTWRHLTAAASKDNKKLWDLERAARLRGFKSREAGTLLPLRKPGSMRGLTSKFDKQVDILSGKFFPSPTADLSDILEDFDTRLDPFEKKFAINRKIDETDIKAVLDLMKPWKAPGWDFLSAGFLKACGKPLRVALAEVAEYSFVLGEWPKQFKSASIVVLPKAGKTPKEKTLPGAYRPIALLSCIGKS